jgi:hypothetical protein
MSKNSYFIPKSATSPVWKTGFQVLLQKMSRLQKRLGFGFSSFARMSPVKNSAGLPAGHKNKFPSSRKRKRGDSDQIMLIHCKRQVEFDAINSQAMLLLTGQLLLNLM